MPGSFDTGRIAPLAVAVIGVSGSGKSTLGALLAEKLACQFLEGDGFHSAANVEKMRHGIALTDQDRWPWLEDIGVAAGTAVRRDGCVVLACSALKRVYRERLAAAGTPMAFVLLDATSRVLERRLDERHGHFMPASLLGSQLQTLERPAPDERAITLVSTEAPQVLVERVIEWLGGA